MVLRKIRLKQSNTEIFTSHGGLTLLDQALELARLKAQLKSLGRYQGGNRGQTTFICYA